MKKATMNLTRAKLYLFAAILAGLATAALWGYYVLRSSMTEKYGDINVTKIEERNKIYSYSIYGDFYYRMIVFDEKGKPEYEYAKLSPTRTNIGYAFEGVNPVPTLSSEDTGESIRVTESSAFDLGAKKKDLDRLKGGLDQFVKEFGRIIAAQDQHILDQAREATAQIQQQLFGKSMGLPPIQIEDFFEDRNEIATEEPAIDNIAFDILDLQYIPANRKSFTMCAKGKWCKNIWRAVFNEADEIYFQYLKQYGNKSIDELIDDGKENGWWRNSLIAITVKPESGNIQPFFLQVDLGDDESAHNKIRAWFIDPNGHAYVLIMKVKNETILARAMGDFLKIAFGIRFKDLPNFTNHFANRQYEILKNAGDFLQNVCNFHQKYVSVFEDNKLEGIESSYRQELGDRIIDFVFPADFNLLSIPGNCSEDAEKFNFTEIDDFEKQYGNISLDRERIEALTTASDLLEEYNVEIDSALKGIKSAVQFSSSSNSVVEKTRVMLYPKQVLGEHCKDRDCLRRYFQEAE